MILGYIRVSPGDASNEDRSSYQIQTDIIEGFAKTRGADKWDVQIYQDAGVSGATKLEMRPAGDRLLNDMRKGDVVVASKLDRMFRSATDALNMIEVFREREVELILFDMGTESVTSSHMAKFIFTILAAVADMERVRIKERTAAGRAAKKAKGGAIGEAPMGFTKVGEKQNAILVPNEKEQRAKALMLELFQKNHGYTDIARILTEKGFTSRSGAPYHPIPIKRVVERAQAEMC